MSLGIKSVPEPPLSLLVAAELEDQGPGDKSILGLNRQRVVGLSFAGPLDGMGVGGRGVHAVTLSVTSLVSYSKRLLCDVMIVAEDVEVEAHRVVLAACSPYFCAMFTGMARGHRNLRCWENMEVGA